jgi:hypothetical protein
MLDSHGLPYEPPKLSCRIFTLFPSLWQMALHRAKMFEREMPIAFNNLAIAQHRDTLRYAHTRSGDCRPKLKRFEVGDLVYLKGSEGGFNGPQSWKNYLEGSQDRA